MGNIIMGGTIINETGECELNNEVSNFLNNVNSLKSNLNELYSAFTDTAQTKIGNGDFNVSEYLDIAKEIKIATEQFSNIDFTVLSKKFTKVARIRQEDQRENINVAPEINDTIQENNNDEIDLKSFGHSITESFLKTKPLGYKLLSDEIIPVKNWKDLYIKTCKQLFNSNEKLFRGFLDNPKMNWTSIKYFTKKKPTAASFVEIEKGVYVNTLFGADEYMSMIRKMLEEYKIDIVEYRVFLKE